MGAPQQQPRLKLTSGFNLSCVLGLISDRTFSLYRDLLDYIGKLVDKRMAEPKNDLISKLVTEQVSTILNLSSVADSDSSSPLRSYLEISNEATPFRWHS